MLSATFAWIFAKLLVLQAASRLFTTPWGTAPDTSRSVLDLTRGPCAAAIHYSVTQILQGGLIWTWEHTCLRLAIRRKSKRMQRGFKAWAEECGSRLIQRQRRGTQESPLTSQHSVSLLLLAASLPWILLQGFRGPHRPSLHPHLPHKGVQAASNVHTLNVQMSTVFFALYVLNLTQKRLS